MKYRDLVRPGVLSLPVYEPGRPIEDVAREFGLDPNGVLKLASNENALGPSPKAVDAAARALRHAHLYPDGGSIALREKLAAVRGLKPEQIFVGTGSNEVMVLLAQALVGPGDEVIFGEYAFIVYKLAALLFGGKPVSVPMPNLAHDLDAMADAAAKDARASGAASAREAYLAKAQASASTATTAEDSLTERGSDLRTPKGRRKQLSLAHSPSNYLSYLPSAAPLPSPLDV